MLPRQLFLLLRKLQKDLTGEDEDEIPLYQPRTTINLRDHMNLSASSACRRRRCRRRRLAPPLSPRPSHATFSLLDEGDAIACNVTSKVRNGQLTARRFMIVDPWRLLLLDANSNRLGSGVVRYAVSGGLNDERRAQADTRTHLPHASSPPGPAPLGFLPT